MAKKTPAQKTDQLEAEIEKAEEDYAAELEEFVDQARFVLEARNELEAAKARLKDFLAANANPAAKTKGKKEPDDEEVQ